MGALEGSGTLGVEGLGTTADDWSFSADSSGKGVFAFSSTATTVSDSGSTVVLFSLGIIGMVLLRRKLAC